MRACVVVAVWLSVDSASAARATCASVERLDVIECIASADHGDTVVIPPGAATWTATVTIHKNIVVQGAGIDRTTIRSNTSDPLISYSADASALADQASGGFFRLTGLTLDGRDRGQILRIGTSVNRKHPGNRVSRFRVDHVRFVDGGGSYGNHVDHNSRGLFDHCEFVNGAKAARIEGEFWFSRDQDGIGLGTANAVVFEDCTFINTEPENNIMSSQDGHSGWVIRFSEFQLATSMSPVLDMHGNNNATVDPSACPGLADYWPGCDESIPDEYDDCCGGGRGVASVELYGNTFSGPGGGKILDQRGGIAMVFGNTMELGSAKFQVRDRERYSYCQAHPEDCDIVASSYYYDNTNHGSEVRPVAIPGSEPDYNWIYEDVNWWTLASDFDGSTGVGTGTWGERPSSCVDGTGYWATDKGGDWQRLNASANDGALYVCGGGDFTDPDDLFYTPLVYPHPLRETVSCASEGHTCCDECAGETFGELDGCAGQVCCTACMPPPFMAGACVEAEAGALVAPMAAIPEAGASAGAYVGTSASSQGSASFSFEVDAAGFHVVHVLVRTPEPAVAHDSFYVTVDGDTGQGDDACAFDLAESSEFSWQAVTRRGDGIGQAEYDPMIWDLGVGRHTVVFWGREEGTHLDQVVLRRCSAADCSDIGSLGCVPSCDEGETRSCYDGSAESSGVGACTPGVQRCETGAWGACDGQVLPVAEDCADGVDNDCNGLVDGADPSCLSAEDDPLERPAEDESDEGGGSESAAEVGCVAGGEGSVAGALLLVFMRRRRRIRREEPRLDR